MESDSSEKIYLFNLKNWSINSLYSKELRKTLILEETRQSWNMKNNKNELLSHCDIDLLTSRPTFCTVDNANRSI